MIALNAAGEGSVTGTETYVDIVCEGGGVRGIALVGALAVLEERGYQPQNLAGTSAGAIIATLRAAEYSPAEIYAIMTSPDFDFKRFRDGDWEDRIPIVGEPLSIVDDLGIYEGSYFLNLMRDLLARKNVRTFRDLIDARFADDPRYRYRVRVVASDVTGRCLLALPQDAATTLGTPPDDIEVALAVRMSMSIPIFFEPVRFKNPATGEEHVIVDGGMLSNFPVWLFDSGGQPDWPTFGLRLVDANPRDSLAKGLSPLPPPKGKLGVLIDYLESLVNTMTQAHDRLYLEQDTFARTIPIDTLGISATDFDITPAQVASLWESGRAAAEDFLKTWDFEAYKAEFRSGKPQASRRADLIAKLQAPKDQPSA